MAHTAVSVHGLTVRIKDKLILDNLDLQVEEGSFHGIIGPNGAGKTTLMTAVQGFRQPTGGTIEVLGQNPYPRNLELLAQLGIQPQQSAFFPKSTLREHLSVVADLTSASRQRVDELIEALDLTHAVGTKVESLSGGEKQRLAVASALVHRPRVLFLDEPTAALDPEARHTLVQLLQSSTQLATTTIYTTHYLDEAERLCDVISIIDDKRVIATQSPSSLIVEAALGSTVLLPSAIHQADAAIAVCGSDAVRLTKDGLTIRTNDTGALFAQLAASGINTSGAQVHDGRLEDAYLQLTGKDYVAA